LCDTPTEAFEVRSFLSPGGGLLLNACHGLPWLINYPTEKSEFINNIKGTRRTTRWIKKKIPILGKLHDVEVKERVAIVTLRTHDPIFSFRNIQEKSFKNFEKKTPKILIYI